METTGASRSVVLGIFFYGTLQQGGIEKNEEAYAIVHVVVDQLGRIRAVLAKPGRVGQLPPQSLAIDRRGGRGYQEKIECLHYFRGLEVVLGCLTG